MRSRAICGLNASPSQIKRNLKTLRPKGYSFDINELLSLASRKMGPIIELLMETPNSTDHFITIGQCNTIEEVSNTIKDILSALEKIGFQTIDIKIGNLNMKKYRESANSQGYIYVDTTLLLAILELHNVIENVKYDLDEFYSAFGTHSFVQTESGLLSSSSNDSSNPNKLVFKLKPELRKSFSSFQLMPSDFVVMPSTSEIFALTESRSQIVASSFADVKDSTIRTSKSASSLEEERISGINDVYGARKVVVRCISDLQDVSDYLGIPRFDASTVCSRAEFENDMDRRGQDDRDKTSQSAHQLDSNGKCCCADCCARGSGSLRDCDDDQVIICIKGCNEDEGDVQIVIRQCPKCKEGGSATSRDEPPPTQPPPSQPPPQPVAPPPPPQVVAPPPPVIEAPKPVEVKQERLPSFPPEPRPLEPEPKISSYSGYKNAENVESTTLHNKDSGESIVCSDEEDEGKPQLDPDFIQNQVRVSCSKIKLFETANLCLKTSTGQELMISLTVTPKAEAAANQRNLTIRDIFSDAELDQDTKESASRRKNENRPSRASSRKSAPIADESRFIPPLDIDDRRSRGLIADNTDIKSSSRSNNSRRSASKGSARSSSRESARSSSQGSGRRPKGSAKTLDSYYVAERYIPLGRTKICSSLDFDVTLAESKIRDRGVQNRNNKIVVKLQELGADNLLRACRPAKCCRKAILNEKMKKCLPYAPSLRSLPLDDEDMQVINQSLQMSLQKVKNSTNLKKDFYNNNNNQVYYLNPVHTVMYLFVKSDMPLNTLDEICRSHFIQRRLSYYINLVNDLQYEPNLEYDVLYFGVESKLAKAQADESFKTRSAGAEGNVNNKAVNVEIVQVVSNPLKWMKQNYNKYDERPGCQSFIMENDLSLSRNSDNDYGNLGQTNICPQPKIMQRKSYVSRIPVYKRNKTAGLNMDKMNEERDNYLSELFHLSMTSLIQQDGIMEKVGEDLPRDIIFPGKARCEDHTEILNETYISNRFPAEKSKNSSKSSLASTTKKSKRKKREFYLSRSKSEISLNTLKQMCKNKTTFPLPEIVGNRRHDSTENSSKTISQTMSRSSTPLFDQDLPKLILNYFTQILYKMILKQMAKDDPARINVATETISLKETYRKAPCNHPDLLPMKKNLHKTDISHHDLKAKQSQYCIVSAKRRNTKRFCFFSNLALQTSTIFVDTKTCQTSNTFLKRFFNSNNTNTKKKRIFKKIYNCDDNDGNPSSCDEIENFIVTFKSDESLSSNFSVRGLAATSCSSRQLIESDQEDSLSQSLLKLKETLETYETIKNEIAKRSLEDANINPIEYFVYQMCACKSKLNKKPSMMQKILSKTKGLFSSVEKDLSKKYNNQRELFSMPQEEREALCRRCGCYISKCGTNTSTNASLLCSCPPDNKPKKPSFEPCCKKRNTPKNKAANNLSKIASASMSSLKCIKSRIKNSSVFSQTKNDHLEPCTCENELKKKNAETICVDPNVTVITCKKKSTSTDAVTKDSATQKCECGKCENFADDGTCCCSHCLGCLDKSFDTKPNSHSVGVDTDPKKVSEDSSTTKNTDSTKKIDRVKNNDPPSKTERPAANSVYTASATTPEFTQRLSGSFMSQVDDDSDLTLTPGNQTKVDEIDNQPKNEEDIEVINTNKNENNKNPNDSTAYFFVAQPPHLFQQFSFESGNNPFDRTCLLNLPEVNMFHMDRPENGLDE